MSHDVQTPLVGIRIVGRDIIEYGRDGFIIMNEEYSLFKKKKDAPSGLLLSGLS